MQGFREFLSERQEIKKVNLNFKEVKSSMSDYFMNGIEYKN